MSRWQTSPLRVTIALATLLIVPGVIGSELILKTPRQLYQYLLVGPTISVSINLLLAFVLNSTIGVTDQAIATVWVGVALGYLYHDRRNRVNLLPQERAAGDEPSNPRGLGGVDVLLVAGGSLLLACYFATQQIANLFLFQTLLPVSQAGAHLNLLTGIEAKGYSLLFFYLLKGSGVDATVFPYLPMGLPILGLTLLGVAYALTRSRHASLFITLIFLFNGGIAPAFYSVFAYVWSLTLYFAFLGLLLTDEVSGTPRILLLGSVLFTTMTIHYTMVGWAMIALLITWITPMLRTTTPSLPRVRVGSPLLIGSTLVGIFVLSYFSLLTSYLPHIMQVGNLLSALFRNVRLLSSYLFGSAGIYAIAYSQLYGLARVLWIIVISGSIGLAAITRLHHWRTGARDSWTTPRSHHRIEEVLLWIFAMTFVIDSIVYGLLGNFSIKYLLFLGPLMFGVAYHVPTRGQQRHVQEDRR
jgi:hypothetical protein